MTARAPAGAAAQKRGVIHVADEDGVGGRLLLEMAAQAKCGIARGQ